MSLGSAIGLAAGILAGMFVLLFVLAAVEEGLFASVMVDPVAEDDEATLEAPPLEQAA